MRMQRWGVHWVSSWGGRCTCVSRGRGGGQPRWCRGPGSRRCCGSAGPPPPCRTPPAPAAPKLRQAPKHFFPSCQAREASVPSILKHGSHPHNGARPKIWDMALRKKKHGEMAALPSAVSSMGFCKEAEQRTPATPKSTCQTSRGRWWKPTHCGGHDGTMSRLCVNLQLSCAQPLKNFNSHH
jgi:hypothetical protein